MNDLEFLRDDFHKAGYDDMSLLTSLTEKDLQHMLEHDMKVEKPGHRMKVVIALRGLLQQQPPQPTSPLALPQPQQEEDNNQ